MSLNLFHKSTSYWLWQVSWKHMKHVKQSGCEENDVLLSYLRNTQWRKSKKPLSQDMIFCRSHLIFLIKKLAKIIRKALYVLFGNFKVLSLQLSDKLATKERQGRTGSGGAGPGHTEYQLYRKKIFTACLKNF